MLTEARMDWRASRIISFRVVLHLTGSSSICVEIGQFDWHHSRPEQLWSRQAIHARLIVFSRLIWPSA
jgi:hypothetical protein